MAAKEFGTISRQMYFFFNSEMMTNYLGHEVIFPVQGFGLECSGLFIDRCDKLFYNGLDIDYQTAVLRVFFWKPNRDQRRFVSTSFVFQILLLLKGFPKLCQ